MAPSEKQQIGFPLMDRTSMNKRRSMSTITEPCTTVLAGNRWDRGLQPLGLLTVVKQYLLTRCQIHLQAASVSAYPVSFLRFPISGWPWVKHPSNVSSCRSHKPLGYIQDGFSNSFSTIRFGTSFWFSDCPFGFKLLALDRSMLLEAGNAGTMNLLVE